MDMRGLWQCVGVDLGIVVNSRINTLLILSLSYFSSLFFLFKVIKLLISPHATPTRFVLNIQFLLFFTSTVGTTCILRFIRKNLIISNPNRITPPTFSPSGGVSLSPSNIHTFKLYSAMV